MKKRTSVRRTRGRETAAARRTGPQRPVTPAQLKRLLKTDPQAAYASIDAQLRDARRASAWARRFAAAAKRALASGRPLGRNGVITDPELIKIWEAR